MAITKETLIGKIEVVGKYKCVQVRTDIVIMEDGEELSRKYNRHSLNAGTLDSSDNLVDNDISGEAAEVQGICNAVWTDAVKLAWKNKLIAEFIGHRSVMPYHNDWNYLHEAVDRLKKVCNYTFTSFNNKHQVYERVVEIIQLIDKKQ